VAQNFVRCRQSMDAVYSGSRTCSYCNLVNLLQYITVRTSKRIYNRGDVTAHPARTAPVTLRALLHMPPVQYSAVTTRPLGGGGGVERERQSDEEKVKEGEQRVKTVLSGRRDCWADWSGRKRRGRGRERDIPDTHCLLVQ
jgi:hypothetical protein